MTGDLDARMRRVKMLLLDVDGVMTDGGIFLGPGEIEMKRFNTLDGMGITLARAAGLRVGILTGRWSEAVSKRAKELKIDEVQEGSNHKEKGYQQILKKYGLRDEEIAYVGDDVFDIPILKRAGFAVCVASGAEDAKKVSHYVTHRKGGDGAVREVVEMLLEKTGKKETALTSIFNSLKEGEK
jgi:3-deoxy-D-manno-octulosonate 8-phosphate phosphatase (KDO 8-P phosphatase)